MTLKRTIVLLFGGAVSNALKKNVVVGRRKMIGFVDGGSVRYLIGQTTAAAIGEVERAVYAIADTWFQCKNITCTSKLINDFF